MFATSKDIVKGSHLAADVLIVGGGAAGITIARHFVGRSHSVLLLESGGLDFDDKVQSLYRGTRTGVVVAPDLDASRLRYFGGTTNHWTGWCRPLEQSDFDKRADWPESGWPITRAQLDPFYLKAATLCQLKAAPYDDASYWQRQVGGKKKIAFLPFREDILRSAIFQVSPPTQFGQFYQPTLKAAPNVTVVLGANVLELLPAQGHSHDTAVKRIGSVLVRTLDGGTFTASGRMVVVAMGGIESARLLLLSNKVHPSGAGNEHDLVGRYFMDHVWLNANCYLHFSHPGIDLPVYFDQLKIAGAQFFATVTASPKLLEREHIGAFRLWMNPSTTSYEGAESLHDVTNSISAGHLPNNFMTSLGNIIRDIDVLADAAYKNLFRTNKGLISSAATGLNRGAWIDLNFEQRPNWHSRVQLGADRDMFGQRRVNVDWRLSNSDGQTAKRALELAAQEFGRLGLGRCRINFDFGENSRWPSNMIASCHHSGTARMADTPTRGVVDANCRVHSVENLYVAGSATFPTIGYANPTLTIVALAQRLAEHLETALT